MNLKHAAPIAALALPLLAACQPTPSGPATQIVSPSHTPCSPQRLHITEPTTNTIKRAQLKQGIQLGGIACLVSKGVINKLWVVNYEPGHDYYLARQPAKAAAINSATSDITDGPTWRFFDGNLPQKPRKYVSVIFLRTADVTKSACGTALLPGGSRSHSFHHLPSTCATAAVINLRVIS